MLIDYQVKINFFNQNSIIFLKKIFIVNLKDGLNQRK